MFKEHPWASPGTPKVRPISKVTKVSLDHVFPALQAGMVGHVFLALHVGIVDMSS